MGGKYKDNYLKSNFELILNTGKTSRDPLIMDKKPPIKFRFKKNIGFYAVKKMKDMQEEKSNIGHTATKKEIYIAGGSNIKSYSLSNVESYDIKRDAWKILPSMNQGRTLPGLCLFRSRFLYAFGG